MSQENEQKQHDTASMLARMNIDINLTVHMDDGTTKDLHLVAHNFKVEKEQQA
jgi:hypothetical protein